jgi:hypothetical protein
MPRVTSQQIRQALLVTGEPVDPATLEKLQLYNELGEPVDTTQDLSAMHWLGPWVAGREYATNDIVSYLNALWISPGEVPTDRPPGWMPSDPVVLTWRAGHQIHASQRIASSSPVEYTIGPPPGQLYDFSSWIDNVHGAEILVDVVDMSLGLVVTVAAVDHEGTTDKALNVRCHYATGGTYRPVGSGSIDSALVNSHTPVNFNVGDITEDLVYAIWYDGPSTNGHFTISVNNPADMVPPPDMSVAGAQWELMLQGVA